MNSFKKGQRVVYDELDMLIDKTDFLYKKWQFDMKQDKHFNDVSMKIHNCLEKQLKLTKIQLYLAQKNDKDNRRSFRLVHNI